MVGIDPEPVTEWVATLGLGERPPLTFTRIGDGQSNLTYLVSDATSRRWVLRRPPLGELLASAHDIVREYRILAALGPAGLPVPAVLGLCEDRGVTDAPLLLMEYVDGLVIDRPEVAKTIEPGVREAVARALPAALADIHAIDQEAIGLGSLSRSQTPYGVRQVRRWRGQWEQSKTRELPLIDELADRLAVSVPEQRETTLVHGDFHLLNVIVAPRDGVVRAVIDWELCALGDPLADLGGLLAYWWEPGELRPPLRAFSALPGVPSRADLASIYAVASGRSLEALGFWHALGLWKVAIIAEGVIRRAREVPGNAAGGGTPTAALVEQVAARAVTVADQAGL